MNKGYQLLQNALILSPCGKAVARITDNKLCVVLMRVMDTQNSYHTSIIDLSGDNEPVKLRRDLDLDELTYTFELVDISVNPRHRVWLPLEWWSESLTGE